MFAKIVNCDRDRESGKCVARTKKSCTPACVYAMISLAKLLMTALLLDSIHVNCVFYVFYIK